MSEVKTETAIALLRKEVPQLQAIMSINRKGDNAAIVLQELDYLQSMILTKPDIEKCLPQSVISAVKTVIKQNLSLDPAAGLVYTQTRKVLVNGKWETVLEIKPSPNGLLSIARQAGRMLDCDRPTIKKDATGKVVEVSFKYLVPTITADGKKGTRWKEETFDESDFERWRIASHREKSRSYKEVKKLTQEQVEKGWIQEKQMPVPNETTMNYANKLYTSWKGGLDPEFARAKAIRHCGLKKSGTNQNEIPSIKFADAKIDPVVDAEIEIEEEIDFTEAEEIPNEKREQVNLPDPEAKLPSASDL